MTRLQRSLLGIALGTILTLFGHPTTRSLLLSAFHLVPKSAAERWKEGYSKPLPYPTNREGASAWLVEAAERMRSESPLAHGELETLSGIAKEASVREPDNAFWWQMQAVIQDRMGKPQEAFSNWERGAICVYYKDHQSEQLDETRKELAAGASSEWSWQYAYVYSQRSDACAAVTEKYARSLIVSASLNDEAGIDRRVVTIANADLLRVGARSALIAKKASDLIELCTYPQDLSKEKKLIKRIHAGAVEIIASLRTRNKIELSRQIDKAFRENDSWRYYIFSQYDIPERTLQYGLESILAATVPGAFLAVSVIGLLIYFLGAKLSQVKALGTYRFISTTVCSLVATALMSYMSGSPLLGLALGCAILFQLANPKHVRRQTPADLGPLYRLTTFSLSLFICVDLAVYVVSLMAPTKLVFLALPFSYDLYSTRDAAAGSLGLALSIYLLCVPMWSFVTRVTSWDVLRMSTLRLGQYVCGFALIQVAILSLVTIQMEGRLKQTWQQILGNEPIYYLTR